MAKQIVSKKKLVEIINVELSKHDECENCRVNGLLKAELDEAGCNWSDPKISCSGTPAEVCRPIAAQVIGKLRQEYNLE